MSKKVTRCITVDRELDLLITKEAKKQRRSISTLYSIAVENLLLPPTVVRGKDKETRKPK